MPGPDELVFVYGTLKMGGLYHSVMREAGGILLGTGVLAIPYPLVLSRYPCLLDQPGKGHQVLGEVYRIPEVGGWVRLDYLEGHPREYRRREETVHLGHRQVQAWTYFYLQENYLEEGLVPVREFRAADR